MRPARSLTLFLSALAAADENDERDTEGDDAVADDADGALTAAAAAQALLPPRT